MKLFFALLICLTTFVTTAQQTEGTIQYKETFKIEIDFDNMSGMTEEMKKMIPMEQTLENVLYFTKDASLYTGVVKGEDKDVEYKSKEDDIEINIKMDAPEHIYYQNLKNKEVTESKDLFDKKFLITGADKMKWKIGTETKEILGYNCTKATAAMDTENNVVEAWFTTSIPTSIGPDKFHGLPGAVLEVNMDGGKRKITATQVSLEKPDESKMVQPKKGKKITSSEYKKLVEEKQKEMAEMYGGKGNFIIKTETIEN